MCTSSSILISPIQNQDVKLLVDLNDQFLPSICGSNFATENASKIVYCDENGNIRVISAKDGAVEWETFQSYHSGFIPGPLFCHFDSSTLYSQSPSAISVLVMYNDSSDSDSLPVKGKLSSMCYDSDNQRLICVSSGYGYEYSEELASQMAYLRYVTGMMYFRYQNIRHPFYVRHKSPTRFIACYRTYFCCRTLARYVRQQKYVRKNA